MDSGWLVGCAPVPRGTIASRASTGVGVLLAALRSGFRPWVEGGLRSGQWAGCSFHVERSVSLTLRRTGKQLGEVAKTCFRCVGQRLWLAWCGVLCSTWNDPDRQHIERAIGCCGRLLALRRPLGYAGGTRLFGCGRSCNGPYPVLFPRDAPRLGHGWPARCLR